MIEKLRRVSQGLTFRLAALLVLALLPIGTLAIVQTSHLVEETRRRSEANLLALTSEAAGGEEALIRTGFGAVETLAAFLPAIWDDPQTCYDTLTDFLSYAGPYSFAGHVQADGTVTCSSSPKPYNAGNHPLSVQMRADPKTRVVIDQDAPISKTSVVIIAMPVFTDQGAYNGYIALSLPHRRIFSRLSELDTDRPVELVTFNGDGEILTAEGGLDDVGFRLPEGRSLSEFVGKRQQAFTGRIADGSERVFAVVPVMSNIVYAIGSWEADRIEVSPGFMTIALPVLFPVLMIIVCLMVGYMAIDRMVIRPTRHLRARMLVFMRSRSIPPLQIDFWTPREIIEMKHTWVRMAEAVMHDEAELEDMLHDKTVLLKEVHHRVKNNLQLIASILNMKIRQARTPDARAALADVQSRVMSLATVHRNLYETSLQGRVDAPELMRAIVDRTISAAQTTDRSVKCEQTYTPLVLYPDQAVPISLILSEAVNNAIKYAGPDQAGVCWIKVALNHSDTGDAQLTVSNSVSEDGPKPNEDTSSGLGSQLVQAFVAQIEGSLHQEATDCEFTLTVTFPVADFVEEDVPPAPAL